MHNNGCTIDCAKNMIINKDFVSDSSTSKHFLNQIQKDLEEILSILKK